MKRDEIIKAIADAGASFEDAAELQKFLPAFYAFEKIAAAKERERCAKVCEEMILYSGFDTAAVIREMGDE